MLLTVGREVRDTEHGSLGEITEVLALTHNKNVWVIEGAHACRG